MKEIYSVAPCSELDDLISDRPHEIVNTGAACGVVAAQSPITEGGELEETSLSDIWPVEPRTPAVKGGVTCECGLWFGTAHGRKSHIAQGGCKSNGVGR